MYAAQRLMAIFRMLAVMTLNAGYFLSILAGTFLGEISFGRHAGLDEH